MEQGTELGTELGSIEREVHVAARPEVVYQVLSTAEHLRQWWPDEVELDPVPGGTGTVSFGHGPDAHSERLTVVEADPPRRFAFRWVQHESTGPAPYGSLLVTFDLTPTDSGTLLRLTETGFREKGWEAAVLEEQLADHVAGWEHFLPRLVGYVERLVAAP